MIEVRQTDLFAEWIANLRDREARARIIVRIRRLSLGNPGDEPAHAIVRVTPSYQLDEFFEAFCRIASSGQLNKAGLPKNPLQFAVLCDHHRAELQLPSPLAQAVAGPAARVLAVIGRAAGFRPDGTRAVRAR